MAAASAGDVACDRCEVVFKISNVWTALEVGSVTIGEDTGIDHMDFSYTPAIEAFLSKQMVEYCIASNLDVAGPGADSSQAMRLGDGAEIA